MSSPPALKKGWLAYYSELMGSWTRKRSNRQDAEDAVQDAAINMLERDAAVLRDHERYFRRAVTNRSISLYRYELLRQTQPLDSLPEDSHPMAPSAQDCYEAEQVAALMLASLKELPEACQTAFQLRQLEDLSNGEIAERMGVSRNMVERYMMRTLRHIQDRLHKHAH